MNNLVFSKNIYSKIIFSIYDKILMKIALPLIWKCTISDIQNLYENHITSNHLDIGAGTGYFIKNSKRFHENAKLAIMDINPVCLQICEKQLKKFKPRIQEQDILKSLPNSEKYDSIGMNLVLHCLPSDMKSKEIAFSNIKRVLNLDGKVFGTTFILQGTKPNLLTRAWADYFNSAGLLCNKADHIEDLKDILDRNFRESGIKMIGHCALFWGKNPV